MDGNAPEEDPPKDAGEHEEIDEGGEDEVACDGEEWNAAEVVSHKRSGEKGAESCDAEEALQKVQNAIANGILCHDLLTEEADAGHGEEGELESYIVQIEGIDAQHDEKGYGTRMG